MTAASAVPREARGLGGGRRRSSGSTRPYQLCSRRLQHDGRTSLRSTAPAPLEASSGEVRRHRLSRRGNRQLKCGHFDDSAPTTSAHSSTRCTTHRVSRLPRPGRPPKNILPRAAELQRLPTPPAVERGWERSAATECDRSRRLPAYPAWAVFAPSPPRTLAAIVESFCGSREGRWSAWARVLWGVGFLGWWWADETQSVALRHLGERGRGDVRCRHAVGFGEALFDFCEEPLEAGRGDDDEHAGG